jgi:membrane protein
MQPEKNSFVKTLSNIARATVFPGYLVSSKRRLVGVYSIRLLFLVGHRLWKDRLLRQAAALAYQTFLSLVPLLAIALAVASTLELEPYMDRVSSALEGILLPAAADAGQHIRDLVSTIKPKTLTIFGGITLVFLAMTLLFNVEQITNDIFRCAKSRKLWLRILTGLALIIFAPLAVGLSFYFTGKAFFLPHAAAVVLPFIFTVTALFLCYWRLPHRKILMRFSLVSALTAGLFFEAVKMGFALYARHLGVTLSYVYGTMAILPLFMIWVYLAWIIFLFGAELNAALHEVKRHDTFEN